MDTELNKLIKMIPNIYAHAQKRCVDTYTSMSFFKDVSRLFLKIYEQAISLRSISSIIA